MFLSPKKNKYTKGFSGKKLFIKNPQNSIIKKNNFGNISLVAEQSGKVTNFQQEALRRFLKRFLKKKALIFFHIFPNVSVTKKPNDIRRGRGKGNVNYWSSNLKKGETILEIRSFDNNFTKQALNRARIKLSIKTFVNDQQKRWIL